jgi:hypothetical protein
MNPNFYRQLILGLYTWWIVEPLLPPIAVPPPGRWMSPLMNAMPVTP